MPIRALPPTDRLHQADTFRFDFSSRLLAMRASGGDATELALEATAFYAESGGQPSDRGTLAGFEVLAVSVEGGVVWHRVAVGVATLGEQIAPGESVAGRIDPASRLDHMQQHTGQHILSQAFLRGGEFPTISFHLGREESTIDLRGERPEPEFLERAMIEANDCVLADRAIRVHFVEREELGRYPLRRDATADVELLRLIEIEEWDWSACGGTHARRTGEVGPIQILGVERIRGDWRVRFLAGRRAMAYFRAAHRLLDGAARTHSMHWTAFADAAAGWKATAAEAEREVRRLRVERGMREGERLAREATPTADGVRVSAYWADGRSPDELRATAARFVEFAPAFFLGGSREGERSNWVAARSDDAPARLPAADGVLRDWLSERQGKGGGNERMARGTSPPSDRADAELRAELAAWIQNRIEKGCGVSD